MIYYFVQALMRQQVSDLTSFSECGHNTGSRLLSATSIVQVSVSIATGLYSDHSGLPTELFFTNGSALEHKIQPEPNYTYIKSI